MSNETENQITTKQMQQYFENNDVTTADISFLMGMYSAKHPKDKNWNDIVQYYILKLQDDWYGTYLKKEPEYTTDKKEWIGVKKDGN